MHNRSEQYHKSRATEESRAGELDGYLYSQSELSGKFTASWALDKNLKVPGFIHSNTNQPITVQELVVLLISLETNHRIMPKYGHLVRSQPGLDPQQPVTSLDTNGPGKAKHLVTKIFSLDEILGIPPKIHHYDNRVAHLIVAGTFECHLPFSECRWG